MRFGERGSRDINKLVFEGKVKILKLSAICSFGKGFFVLSFIGQLLVKRTTSFPAFAKSMHILNTACAGPPVSGAKDGTM
jgi:hypothetical protein